MSESSSVLQVCKMLKDCLEINETKRKRPCSESTTVNAESLKCSRSQLGDLIKLEHVWVLDNWQSNMQLLDVTEFINSPVFFSDIDKSIRWQIQIFPKGEHEEVSHHISLFVNLFDPPENLSMTVSGKLSLLNSNNDVLAEGKPWDAVEFGFDHYSGWGYAQMAVRSSLVLPDGKLKVKCELVYESAKRCSTTEHLKDASATNEDIDSLVDHFQQLMDDKPECDVSFVVGGVCFPVHKSVLSSVSTVFRDIFTSDRVSSTFDIDDIESTVFAEVLRFIYTKKVNDLDEMARKILVVAHNYQLVQLKAQCEAYLVGDITLENCSHLLILSDRYSATVLKEAVLAFVRPRLSKVTTMASWKRMLNLAKSSLLQEISTALNNAPISQ